MKIKNKIKKERLRIGDPIVIKDKNKIRFPINF